MSTKKKTSVKDKTDDHFEKAKGAHDDHHDHEEEDVARQPWEEWIKEHQAEYNKIMGTVVGISFLLFAGTVVILYLRQGTSCETGKIKISLYMSIFFNLMNVVVSGLLMTRFGRDHANGWVPYIYIGVIIFLLFIIQFEYFKA